MTTNTHRVAIIGAGAAGLSAAYALSKHPDRFAVIVFEKESVPGGVARSIDVAATLCGASYVNEGVQGCSPAFANTLRIFRELGFPPVKVDMQCASHTFCRRPFLSLHFAPRLP
jgi:protoporphyrinogen oxidase